MPITPGTLGGMGRMPGSMGGGQFGGAAGSMGGPQNQNAARRRRFTGAPQGSGQITPGVMGGMGTPANFNASSITPGTIGGAMGEPQGSGQITPGVLGGMGTVPGSASPITPGEIGDPAWRQGLGNRFDAAVGAASQPSPITPGVLGGGGTPVDFTAGPITPGTIGQTEPMGDPGPLPPPQRSTPVPYTPPPQRSPGFLDQGSMADERSRQMDMARDWQMGINKNAQIGGVPVDASQMWQLVEARNRMAAGGGPAGPQMGAPPPPMSSPGFPGALPPRPGQGREGDFSFQRTMPGQGFGGQFSRQRTWDTPTPWTPPGRGFEGQFSRPVVPPWSPPPNRTPPWIGPGPGPMERPPGFPGRPPMPMPPGMFPPGFRRGGFPGRPPMPPRGLPRRPPGMFPGGPQIPLNGGPPRYPAGHPMGGAMGQMALRGLYGRMA